VLERLRVDQETFYCGSAVDIAVTSNPFFNLIATVMGKRDHRRIIKRTRNDDSSVSIDG
jgi:hypothetical protein